MPIWQLAAKSLHSSSPSLHPLWLWIDALGCQCVICRRVCILWSRRQGQQKFLALALVLPQPALPSRSDNRNDGTVI
jgi:hypothetical protein